LRICGGLIVGFAPENNQGMSAALKNVIDWTSKPNVWRGKPVASIGASEDQFGTILAQHQLRQTLVRP
jgi:NAD(P)H-dependent FMN reductase